MSAKKKSEKEHSKKTHSRDDLLMENFITLQKVLTNLTVRVDALTDQTSKLLSLFEVSAKSLAQKQGTSMEKDDKEFLYKLDQLIEQNKLIARGITAIDEKQRLKEANYQPPINMQRPQFKPKPLPRNRP